MLDDLDCGLAHLRISKISDMANRGVYLEPNDTRFLIYVIRQLDDKLHVAANREATGKVAATASEVINNSESLKAFNERLVRIRERLTKDGYVGGPATTISDISFLLDFAEGWTFDTNQAASSRSQLLAYLIDIASDTIGAEVWRALFSEMRGKVERGEEIDTTYKG